MFESVESLPGEPVAVAPGVHRLRLVPAPRPAGERLAELLAQQPSADTLVELAAFDPAGLDPGERVQVLQLWERCGAWVAARTQEAIVDVAGAEPPRTESGRTADDWAALDVACALRLSPGGAARRITVARELTGRLRATLRALECGAISFWYALSLVEEVTPLDDDAAHAVEAKVLDGADQLTVRAFRARLRRAVIGAAPKDADARHAHAAKERRVVYTPDSDGMAWLSQYLTVPQALAAYKRISAHAQATAAAAAAAAAPAGEGEADPDLSAGLKPIDAHRADAFLALLFGAQPATAAGTAPSGSGNGGGSGSGEPAPPRNGKRARGRNDIGVTIDLATLLRLAEHPGELAGYGPIPPELARALAADGLWRRLIIDPATGHLLDYGRSTYRPPAALVDYLHARDLTCRFPGCTQPAMRCDQDHAHPWDCDGGTCSANMGALCRRHHRAKTHADWQLHSHPDGSATWTNNRTRQTVERPAINHAPEHVAHLARAAAQSADASDPDAPVS